MINLIVKKITKGREVSELSNEERVKAIYGISFFGSLAIVAVPLLFRVFS